jgi:serine/threonine protein kinase
MALSPGTKLGPYELGELLGVGGMGEVYRARDPRLQRDVAIKVLPREFADVPEKRQRLEREARAISALSHPHICTLFDIGHQDGMDFLVIEYLEGETLAQRLDRGALPSAQVLKIGADIADALDKAHRQGIIHRDLKPANIMLTKGGAKLLDFGLAKPMGLAPLDLMVTQTLTSGQAATMKPLTGEGALVGTLQYMAPEQLEGKEADARSDIFAFGAVLYEMATGKRAFAAKSQASVVAAILEHEPEPLSRLQPMCPLGLEHVVQRCLAKDPEDRWQSATDLASELRWIGTSSSSDAIAVAASRRQRTLRWQPWVLGAAVVLVAVAISWMLASRGKPQPRQQFAIPVNGEVNHLALSPDGKYLAFVSPDESSGSNMVYVQEIGNPDPKLLPGTEGANYPFWSPDDVYVAFFAEGKLKKVPAAGGAPIPIANAGAARGGTWSRQNVILFTPDAGGGMRLVNADGSNNRPSGVQLDPGEASHRWPQFLPDGDHYLYWRGDFTDVTNPKSGIYLGSLKTGAQRRIVGAASNAGYANGKVFFLNDKGALVFAPLDVSAGKLSGEPQLLSATVGFAPSTYWGAFSVAENGTVVWNTTVGAALSTLTWYDRSGKELGHVGQVGTLANPMFSPDGGRVAVDIADQKARNVDLWIESINTGTEARFTFSPVEETNPTWMHHGDMIAFRRVGTSPGLLLKKANGLEPEKVLLRSPDMGGSDLIPNSWSADDSKLMATYQSDAGGSGLVLISAFDAKMTPFNVGTGSSTNGQISPDGKWVAYAGNDTGDWEIYVTTYPGATGKWQVSRGGGAEPRWSADGKEIFYLGPKEMLTAVTVSADSGFTTGVPQPLFQVHSRAPISSTDLFTYDVAPDGKRFLVNRYVKPEHIAPLNIVLNATGK